MEPARFCYNRGNLVLIGACIDAIARASIPHIPVDVESDDPYLIIVAKEDELRQSSKKFDESSLRVVDQDSIIDLGLVASQDDFYFNAVFWKEGIEMRRNLGLPFKQLHIALTRTNLPISEVNLRSVILKVLNVIETCNYGSVDSDRQVSLVVDHCKVLAQDPSLTATTRTEIAAVLRHISSIPRFRNRNAVLLDLLAVVLYKTKDMEGCMAASKELMSVFPKDPRGYFRCAACYFHIGKSSLRERHGAAPPYCWKLAMMLYAETVSLAQIIDPEQMQDHQHVGYRLADKLVLQACQGILLCAKYTEFGCLTTCAEAEVFPKEYLHLTLPWNPGVRNAVLEAFIARGEPDGPTQLLSLESRERLCIYDNESRQFLKLPRFFRWITPFRVAAMSTPKNGEHIWLLSKLGIGTVVTLTKEEELNSTWFELSSASHPSPTSNVFVPVANYKAPTISQVDYFFSLIDQSGESNFSAVLVHCGGGKGRAGTFVACYLARYGFICMADQQPKYTPTELIKIVRHMRPGSIETDEQEFFIASFVKELWKRAQTAGQLLLLPEPESKDGSDDLQIEGKFNPKCKMLVCCGIPGSGKSTVSKSLAAAGWTVASQDETGSREGCAAVVSNAMRRNKSVIVDRCNPTVRDRKEWIDLAMVSPHEVSCLFFDYDKSLCLQRAKLRLNHPTLTSDSQCTNAIRSMSKSLKPPSMSEGFGSIVIIRSIAAANKFVQHNCCGTAKSAGSKASSSSSSTPSSQASDPELRLSNFHKFPRTRHLLNFGSATRDDLVMTKAEAAAFFSSSAAGDMDGEKVAVTFEEKVDGANLGFSIDPETGHITAQNRSHFVNSKSHPQFKKLDFWIENHREDLLNVLCPQHTHCKDENSSQGPYILFGEWLQATHSIRYTRLPDYFLAFDVYDVAERKFWSRERFWTAITSTSIHAVPQIPFAEDTVREEVFKELMGRQSAFWDGGIEGVYVRRDRGPFLLDRGKVVRSDFISGNTHWSKQAVALENVIKRF